MSRAWESFRSLKSRSAVAALACAGAICLWAAPSAGADPTPSPTDTMYWNNYDNTTGDIQSANLDNTGGGLEVFTGTQALIAQPLGTAIDAATGKIYWANSHGAFSSISFANLDGSDAQNLNTFGATVAQPRGVAIDPAANKIYWANYGDNANALSFANLDNTGNGGNLSTAGSATAPNQAQGVSIDPAANKIYWGNEVTDKISFTNLDGTGNSADLNVSGAATAVNDPTATAIDKAGGRIYWTSDNVVASAKLDNSGDSENLAGVVGPGRGLAIDPAANKLYWGTFATNIDFTNLDGSGSAGTLDTSPVTPTTTAFPSILKAPAGAGNPQVSGGSTLGQTLSCSNGSYAPDLLGAFLYRAPASFAYQWSRDGSDVSGATSNTVTADQGGSYTCKVTATNHAGSTSQTSDAVTVKASNEFKLGSVKKNKKKGTAKLPVTVPGGGTLDLSGTKVKGATQNPSSAGTVDFTVKAKGKAKKKLKKKGKAKVSFSVTFSPTGGDQKTEDSSVKLTKKKKH